VGWRLPGVGSESSAGGTDAFRRLRGASIVGRMSSLPSSAAKSFFLDFLRFLFALLPLPLLSPLPTAARPPRPRTAAGDWRRERCRDRGARVCSARCRRRDWGSVRLTGGWCWFVLREKYCWLVTNGWFVVREKYCWLVADKPSAQAVSGRPAADGLVWPSSVRSVYRSVKLSIRIVLE
jgi:hypothetical protein